MEKIKIHAPAGVEVIKKSWGEEVIIHNSEDYCGKILRFKPQSMFSMHFHARKAESWFINKGDFVMDYIDTKTAQRKTTILREGMVIHIPRLQPHKLTTLDGGEIFEVSNQHFDDDSYRVEKGDSQK